jgi:hypothetical protein
MPQLQTYGEDTISSSDKLVFYKNSSNVLKTTTFTNFCTAVRTAIASFFTSSSVVPSTVPSAGEVLVGNGTAYAKQALSGDVTMNSSGVTAIGSDKVTYAKMQNVSAASKLIGRGSAAGSGDPEEIAIGSGLSMVGTTLTASGGTGNVSAASDLGADNVLVRSDGTGKNIQPTGIEVDDDDNVNIPGDVTADSLVAPEFAISATHASNNTFHGFLLTGLLSGATLAQWEAVYLDGSSTWQKADANGVSTYPARGLVVAAYASTDPAEVLLKGTVRNDAWNWTPGGDIYLSTTAGGLTQTAPASSGDKVQKVGFALTADVAFFNFGAEYTTV